VATGCTQVEPSEDQEDLGNSISAVVINNGIINNGIVNNGIVNNGIVNNGIVNNGLSLPNRAAIEAPTAEGDAARLFMQYAIACAFKPSQAFDFSWTDADGVVHAEHYAGQLGLAPHWATKALGMDGQHLVSACMAAHVNYNGVHVTVSIRSGEHPLRLHSNDPELDDFPNIEGAFWGNIFSSNPYINACYQKNNVDNSRALGRDCAAGHLLSDGTVEECGIINIVGECKNVCKKYSASRGYYEDCRQQPGVSNKRTDLVLTTALP